MPPVACVPVRPAPAPALVPVGESDPNGDARMVDLNPDPGKRRRAAAVVGLGAGCVSSGEFLETLPVDTESGSGGGGMTGRGRGGSSCFCLTRADGALAGGSSLASVLDVADAEVEVELALDPDAVAVAPPRALPVVVIALFAGGFAAAVGATAAAADTGWR